MTEPEIITQLVRMRYSSGLTQQDVAERMGRPRSTVAKIEGGRYFHPTLATITSYAAAIGAQLTIDTGGTT